MDLARQVETAVAQVAVSRKLIMRQERAGQTVAAVQVAVLLLIAPIPLAATAAAPEEGMPLMPPVQAPPEATALYGSNTLTRP